jgi:DNA transformation protein
MSANDDLLEILKEALDRTGTVDGRRMFGGVGVYFDGTFFAIIDDDAIYLKTSDETRESFRAEGSSPFSYMTKKGRAELHSYWRLPERLLDETDALRKWARASIAGARQAASKTPKVPAAKR